MRYVAELNRMGHLELRSLREAYVFVSALASAGDAAARIERESLGKRQHSHPSEAG